jgi:hypothetical protein
MEKKVRLCSTYTEPEQFETAIVEVLRDQLRHEAWEGAIGNEIIRSKFDLREETPLLEVAAASDQGFLITTKRIISNNANSAKSLDLDKIGQFIRGTKSQRQKLRNLKKQNLELANRYFNTEIRILTLISNDGSSICLSFKSIPLMRATINLIYSIQRRERWKQLPTAVRKQIAEYPSTTHNRQLLAESEMAGCISCLQIFSPNEIVNWRDSFESMTGETALCPNCGDDSIVGSASGIPITLSSLSALNEISKICF